MGDLRVKKSSIKNRVLDFLEQLSHPTIKGNLFETRSVLDVQADNNSCDIALSRDGLSQDAMRALEGEIRGKLFDLYHRDSIQVVFHHRGEGGEEQSVDSAQLRVGHEKKPQGKKKKLEMVGKLIAIASGKGGVGKSSITVNLALSLKNLGFKVGVVDADIYGPSLPMLFGKREARPIASKGNKILPVESFGIPFMSFGFFVDEKTAIIWRGPMLGGVINQFLFDVDWPELDYLLIDLPPGTGDTQLSLAQMIELHGVVIVSTPQDVALLDARRGMQMFEKLNVPVLGMIQNMSYFVDESGKKHYIFGQDGVKQETKNLGIPFLGDIPLEIALRKSVDSGIPYMSQNQYSDGLVWSAFSSVAEHLSKAI